jgi:deoxycytidine triphosphate deaminase
MSHLSYSEILKNIENGNIIADGVKPEQIKDQSIDVNLGRYIFIREESVKFSFKFFKQYLWLIFVAKRIEFKGLEYFMIELNHNKPFWAIPGMFILAYTNEFIGTVGGSNLQPSFKLKSTSARHGIQHPLAGLGEVGFFNRWCLELTFAVPVELRHGDLVGQIYFDTVIGKPSDYADKGSYQSISDLKKLKAEWQPEDILPGNIKNVL